MSNLIDISEITSVNPDDCFIVVFDKELNLLGTRKPNGPKNTHVPQQVTTLTLGEPIFNPDTLTVTIPYEGATGEVMMKAMGIRDWKASNVFQLEAYQVRERKKFTFYAYEIGKENQGTVFVDFTPPLLTDPTITPPKSGAIIEEEVAIPTSTPSLKAGEPQITRWNPEYMRLSAEVNAQGLGRIVEDADTKSIRPAIYYINGKIGTLPEGFVYKPGDEIVIYKAITDNPDVYHADWVQKSYAQVYFPYPTTNQTWNE